MKTLLNMERTYFSTITDENNKDVERALEINHLYYERLFELYKSLTNLEEKTELSIELDYLLKQARLLKHIQLNQPEETA